MQQGSYLCTRRSLEHLLLTADSLHALCIARDGPDFDQQYRLANEAWTQACSPHSP